MVSLASFIAAGNVSQLSDPIRHVDRISRTADAIPVSCMEIPQEPAQYTTRTVCSKKASPKVVCHLLSNHSTQQWNACMKADDGHFKYRRIDYFVVQMTTDFLCHITKYDAFFCFANIPWTSEMTTWSPKKFNSFVTILCDYECVINMWNFM